MPEIYRVVLTLSIKAFCNTWPVEIYSKKHIFILSNAYTYSINSNNNNNLYSCTTYMYRNRNQGKEYLLKICFRCQVRNFSPADKHYIIWLEREIDKRACCAFRLLEPRFHIVLVSAWDCVTFCCVGWHKKDVACASATRPGLPSDPLGLPAARWEGFEPGIDRAKGE